MKKTALNFVSYSIISPLILFIPLRLNSQFYNLPSEYLFSLSVEKNLAKKDSSIHSSVKPYVHFYSKKFEQPIDSTIFFKSKKRQNFTDALFNKHFVTIESKKEKYRLHLDPLLNLEIGRDFSEPSNRRLYNNTRGFIASGFIGERFYFESLFSENQSFFPTYLSNFAQIAGVVPGQGRWKNFKVDGYDYAFSSGFFSWQPAKNINVQAGHGKQKIGHGYRSLLLSDNAFNYPFARITQQWFRGRLQYTNLYAVLMNLVPASVVINPNTERLFQKKGASFQYLSLNATKSIQIGLFQGLIWQAGDKKNRQNISWQFFNPLIFSNLPSYGLQHKNNILLGSDLKIKLNDKVNFYAQYMLDHLQYAGISDAGEGVQLGLNYFEAMGIKNLFLQAEYNYVSPTSYANTPNATTNQSFTHYNQLLAYTPIEGREFVFIADYKYKRFYSHAQLHRQEHEPLRATDRYQINIVNVRLGYVLNPAYNLNICLGLLYRSQNFHNFTILNNETNYLYFGFRTGLYNLYYDF